MPHESTTRTVGPPQAPKLGDWIAQCGPGTTTARSDVIWGLSALVMGAAVLVFSLFVARVLPPKDPKDAGAITALVAGFGGLFTLAGIGLLIAWRIEQTREIHLFQKGLVKRVGRSSQIVPWSQITSVKLKEHYENRNAPKTYRVVVKVNGQRTVRFPSTMVGDSKRVINQISKHVEDVEIIPWQM